MVPPREEPIGPEPEMVLPVDPSETSVETVYVDDSHLYFDLRPRGIYRVPREDARPETMEAVAPSGGGQMLLDDVFITRVYDADVQRTRVYEVDKSTLAIRITDLPELGYFQASTADDQFFYVVGIGCANPTRVARAGGESRVLEFPAISEGGTARPVVDEQYFYCTNGFTMIQAPKDLSATAEVLLADHGFYQFLYDDGEYLLWLQEGEPGTRERSLVSHFYKMNKRDLVPVRLGSTDEAVSSGLVVYEAATQCWHVMRAGRNHGYVGLFCPSTGFRIIANQRSIRSGIAVDDDYIYWGEYDGIKRVPNPAPR